MNFQEALSLVNGTDYVVYALPVFIVFLIGEAYVIYREGGEMIREKDTWASVAMGFGSVGLNLLAKTCYFFLFMFLYERFAIFDIGYQWWAWVLIFFADDFSFYWHHRMSHQVNILWAAHSVHHSSEKYNLSTAGRQSWTEWFHKYVFWIWLPIIGFHPLMILTMMSFNLIYQYFLHTETVGKLGFLENFMNTPSHHRVHHGSNVKYLDRNHAGMLIIWDKMFGTFEPEDQEEPVVYGLTSNINTYNPFKIAFIEYARLRKTLSKSQSFKHTIQYILRPPGWSPDGSTLTADEMREKYDDR